MPKTLDDLVTAPKAVRRLKNFSFPEGSELTLTDSSQGGACSKKNTSFFTKAQDKSATPAVLTDNQKRILEELGEEYNPLAKSADNNEPSSSETPEGVTKEKGNDMTDLEKALAAVAKLEKQLVGKEIQETLSGYALGDEVSAELTKALLELDEEQRGAVTKSLDVIVAREAAVIVEKDEAIAKAAEKPEEEVNEVAKALLQEDGHEEVQADETLKKSMTEQLDSITKKED